MKILFATYWYLPHVGGVNNYIQQLATHLENEGHHVDVLAHHPDMSKIWMMSDGRYIDKTKIKDYVYEQVLAFFQRHLPLVDPWVRWREIERYTFELCASLLGVSQYDLIHTQDIISTRAIARIKPPNVRHVATIHGILATEHLLAGEIESRDSMSFTYAKAEEFFGFTSADRTIVPSRWVGHQAASGFGVPLDELTHIPYGLDITELKGQAQRKLDSTLGDRDRLIILCPARLVPVKGHQYLFEALASMLPDYRLMLWLAGEGRHREELQRQVTHNGIEGSVRFLGTRSDIPALMQRADMVVLPSVQDALPFSIMEAQALGKPIVATRTGGIPEMIESGTTGLLVDPANAPALASALTRLAESPDLRAKLGQQASTWAHEAWSLDKMLEKTETLYKEAIRGHGGR